MTTSLCKHSFPVQPPHGSLTNPGPCTNCGTPWPDVQAELRRQEEALIVSTSRNGTCPDCRKPRRLFRWQPQDRPWHPVDHEQPVGFLCINCWNDATNADQALAEALIEGFTAAQGPTP